MAKQQPVYRPGPDPPGVGYLAADRRQDTGRGVRRRTLPADDGWLGVRPQDADQAKGGDAQGRPRVHAPVWELHEGREGSGVGLASGNGPAARSEFGRVRRCSDAPTAQQGTRPSHARSPPTLPSPSERRVEDSLRGRPQVAPQRGVKRIQGTVQRGVDGLTDAHFGLARKVCDDEPATTEIADPEVDPEIKIRMRQAQLACGRRHTDPGPASTGNRSRAPIDRSTTPPTRRASNAGRSEATGNLLSMPQSVCGHHGRVLPFDASLRASKARPGAGLRLAAARSDHRQGPTVLRDR